MSLAQLADVISGGGLFGLTPDEAVDACYLTCSACVFDGYAHGGDYLLYLVDCASRDAVQLGRPVPLPPGQPGYEEMRGMAAGNIAQGLCLARVGYPGVIVYQSDRHHLMAFRRSLVLLFERDVHWPPAEFATRLYSRSLSDIGGVGIGGIGGIALPSLRTLACILTRAVRSCAGCGQAGGVLRACSLCRSVWYCGEECHASHWRLIHRVACSRSRAIEPSAEAWRLVEAALGL